MTRVCHAGRVFVLLLVLGMMGWAASRFKKSRFNRLRAVPLFPPLIVKRGSVGRGETGERRNPTPSFLLSPRSPRALRFRARYTINGVKRGMFLEITHHGADPKDLEMWHSKFHSVIAVHCKACFSSVFTENKGHKKLKCLPFFPPQKFSF